MKISTSFLSSNNILDTIEKLSLTDANYIHVDFIDGKFVKGKKIPFRKLKGIENITSKRLDIHLMTNKLDKYIPKFCSLNCEYITFHIEATTNPEKYIKLIHSYGIKCGIALNPETSIDLIKPYLDIIDLVLVMTVEPGYGGQEFMPEVVLKLKKLRKYIDDKKLVVLISADGGINKDTIKKVKSSIDIVVSGSYITNSTNYQNQIDSLK